MLPASPAINRDALIRVWAMQLLRSILKAAVVAGLIAPRDHPCKYRLSIGRPSAVRRKGVALTVGGYLVYIIVVYLTLPANPDPVELPADQVRPFRVVAFPRLSLF